MKIEPIKSDHGYRSALKEVERLMNADRNSSEGDRLVPASRFRDSIPAGRSDDTVEVGHFDSPEV